MVLVDMKDFNFTRDTSSDGEGQGATSEVTDDMGIADEVIGHEINGRENLFSVAHTDVARGYREKAHLNAPIQHVRCAIGVLDTSPIRVLERELQPQSGIETQSRGYIER